MRPTRPLRVGFVAHSGGVHGAERTFVEMVRGVAGLGAVCIAVVPEAGFVQKELERSGLPCRVFPYKWWAMPASLPRRAARGIANLAVARSVAAHFRRNAVDVVLTNCSVVPVGALAARWMGKPHAWFVNELIGDVWVPFDLGPERTLRFIDRWSSLVLVGSQSMRTRLLDANLPAARLAVIAPVFAEPARTAKQALAPGGNPRAVIVGRVGAGKGQLDAVRAVGRLASEGLHVDLIVVGSGSPAYEEQLRAEAGILGIASRVRMAGHVADDEVRAEVGSADLVLVCSRDETFGRGTLEAMALGRPIVATGIPATAELIRDGWSGFLYPPGDADALADRVRRLLTAADRGAGLGENARRWVDENFSAAENSSRLLDVLEGLRSPGG